jgi:hypothetical protein
MNKNFFIAVLVVCCTCALGFYQSSHSLKGLVFVPKAIFGRGRMPASVPRNLDFSFLQGTALREAAQKRLIAELKVWPEANRVGIQLGHFITKGSNGWPVLACEFYDRVELKFEGEGSADDGEKPQMQVQAPCHESQDLGKMQILWIPTSRFTQAKPTDGEIEFPDLSQDTKYRFSAMGRDWPTAWNLSSIKLYNDTTSAPAITVTRDELREVYTEPIMIHW